MYDVAVVGLGGMGSAALAHCAARGASVIGLEQFARGHELGASSGKTRLIRKAYFEDPHYVPLLHRAYALWRDLEQNTGAEILRITGLLTVGQESSAIINGTARAAREYALPVERLGAAEISARYPHLRLRDGEVGVFEADGGVLKPERAIEAHLAVAEKRGAEMRFETQVREWRASGAQFVIGLSDGSELSARALVLSSGPWMQDERFGIPLRVQRNVQVWFTPSNHYYDAGVFPPFLVERVDLPAPLYGFPDFGDGVKVAFHGSGEMTTAQMLNREIDLVRDVEPVARATEQWMPGAAAKFRAGKVCMYALTPDHHFVVDRHPQHANAILCGGFSGHGFKFAPVIGEIAADLALNGTTRHPIAFLALQRFAR